MRALELLNLVPFSPLALVLAVAADLAFGDPEKVPHPVRWMGSLASALEAALRRALPAGAAWERLGGAVLWAAVVGVSYSATALALYLSYRASPTLAIAVAAYFVWAGLSIKGLGDEAMAVVKAAGAGLDEARRRLSRIVGRDTASLSEEDVMRAAVETVAENASDGVVAPLFFLALGGPALMMAYKAVNTLDSMVGYRSERYRSFGWFSARCDDAASFIPARLTGALIISASFVLGYNWKRSAAVMARDGRKHPSPNSGVPEAAMAGALGVRLGGGASYNGVFSEKPRIGDPLSRVGAAAVASSVRIMRAASFIMASLVFAFRALMIIVL